MAEGAYCFAYYSVAAETNNAEIASRNVKWLPTWSTAYTFA